MLKNDSSPRPELTFSCPENWNRMEAKEGGRHCGKCNVVVTDFTKMKTEEIISTISNSNLTHACGHFAPVQLEKPFGDKRDKLIAYYQKVKANARKKYFIRSFQLGLATLLLFLSGCHRHVQGRMKAYTGPVKSKPNSEQQSLR